MVRDRGDFHAPRPAQFAHDVPSAIKDDMALTRRTIFGSGLAALANLPPGTSAKAEAWPTKPLTIVVPYAAGSATDTLSRLMAE
jgi:hypothetical protein